MDNLASLVSAAYLQPPGYRVPIGRTVAPVTAGRKSAYESVCARCMRIPIDGNKLVHKGAKQVSSTQSTPHRTGSCCPGAGW
jgi:hypothetical protein